MLPLLWYYIQCFLFSNNFKSLTKSTLWNYENRETIFHATGMTLHNKECYNKDNLKVLVASVAIWLLLMLFWCVLFVVVWIDFKIQYRIKISFYIKAYRNQNFMVT